MLWLFIGDVLSVGKTVITAGEQVFGGGGDNLPLEQYYPPVKAGQLLCPGPFDIAEVAAAIRNNPRFEPQIDAFLARDNAWLPSNFGPLTTPEQKASAAVNWAHGGRNCRVTEGEISPQLAQILRQLLAAEAERQRQAAQSAPAAAAEAVTDTLQAQGVSPLQLGLGVATLFLLLRGGN